jgi:alkylated DNA repair dioxygenase AlkB
MAQLTLFQPAELVLIDGECGRVTYTARFVDEQTANTWFADLRSGVSWQSERRVMYEREVDVPRLTAGFRLDKSDGSTPRSVRDAARLVIERLDVPFDSVGLNLYRDGRDSVAPHNDHLDEIRKGFPIALLSLGATRRMTFRAKERPHRSMHLDLEPGSLLVMDYATQLHHTHGVPKTTNRVGERISLAFRVKRATDRIYR